MRTSDDDYPQIGQRRSGMVLVCHGDDRPDQFADWLQPLVIDFERLSSIASEFSVDLTPQDRAVPIADVIDFCERLGIEFNTTRWEGSMVSGVYHFGWIKVGTVRSASACGRKLIRTLELRTDQAIRQKIMRDLQSIRDLDEFIERTADDRDGLGQKIIGLNFSLHSTKIALAAAHENISKAAENNTGEIDQACVRLASALLSGDVCRVIAGPLVLWDDGVVYAICSWGSSPIPAGSSPAVLLEAIQRSGRQVVQVRESTVIGAWTSGPVYRHGPTNINGWSNVWTHREHRERTFFVDPPESAEQVRKIHNALASS